MPLWPGDDGYGAAPDSASSMYLQWNANQDSGPTAAPTGVLCDCWVPKTVPSGSASQSLESGQGRSKVSMLVQE